MKPADSRQPLDADLVAAALRQRGWSEPLPQLLGAEPSLPAAAAALAAAGAPDGTTVVAESSAVEPVGLGPVAPAGAALHVATVVRTADVDPGRPRWLPLVASLAVADAVRETTGLPGEVGWPDRVAVTAAMCGGNGGQRSMGTVGADEVASAAAGADAVVLTLRLNVSLNSLEMPPGTTSVYAEGGPIDRVPLLAAVLTHLAARLAEWRADAPALRRDYWDACLTIGRLVDAEGSRGVATGVGDDGSLLVEVDGVTRAVPVSALAATSG